MRWAYTLQRVLKHVVPGPSAPSTARSLARWLAETPRGLGLGESLLLLDGVGEFLLN